MVKTFFAFKTLRNECLQSNIFSVGEPLRLGRCGSLLFHVLFVSFGRNNMKQLTTPVLKLSGCPLATPRSPHSLHEIRLDALMMKYNRPSKKEFLQAQTAIQKPVRPVKTPFLQNSQNTAVRPTNQTFGHAPSMSNILSLEVGPVG